MSLLNLLLNLPGTVSDADRAAIMEVRSELEVQIAPAEFYEHPDRIDGRNAVVLVTERIPRELDAWPKLRFVQILSAGINQLAEHPIWKRGIPVATASGLYSVPMAQFATAALLSLAHRMTEITQLKLTNQWPSRVSLKGSIVRGKTVGILGYGSIGRECARQFKCLGMRIVCMSRGCSRSNEDHFLAWPGTGDPHGEIPEQWFTPDQIHEMLPLCDILLVAAPRTPATESFIGARELALLPPNAHVIVISRGGIVDETALAQALHSGHIGGAWVDAYLSEPPLPSHPLFAAPNVVLTPHMSGVYNEYWSVFPRLLAENLRRLSNAEPLLNLANGELGY
jgi:phosphoglycerate dehydrogenase-like enzyme